MNWKKWFWFLVLGVFLWSSCGGPKKLSREEYLAMSTQDRIVYLTRQIEKHPNDLQLKKMLYQEYLAANMTDQAITVMEQILQTDPYQADVQFQYGKIMYNKGKFHEAYQAFRQALQSPGGEAYKDTIASMVAGKYAVQQVTTDSTDEAFPCFSPDGSKLIYQKYVNGNWDIYERDLSSGEERPLISSPADETLPQISPDGKWLVYVSNADDHRPIKPRYKAREIYIMNLEDSTSTNLTQTIADDWLPRFSHNGKQIVFVSDRADLRDVPYTEKQSDIYVMNIDGAFQLPLTREQSKEGGACFSQDDTHIFFHSNKNGNYDIFQMDVDGSHVLTIIDDPKGNDVCPVVSPDGEHMVFYSDRDGNYEIYQARIDGKEQERLTFNPAEDLNPVYSPDGKVIAFHTNRNGNYDIYFINLEMPATSITMNDLISRLDQLISR